MFDNSRKLPAQQTSLAGGVESPAGRIEVSRQRIGVRVTALAGWTLGVAAVLSPHTVTSVNPPGWLPA